MSIAAIVRALVEAGCTPEQILRAVEAAEAANADKLTARQTAERKRSARYLGRRSVSSKVWAALRHQVIERDGLICAYCRTEQGPFNVDHVVPLSRGGTDNVGNLVVACRACNASKRDRLVSEWRAAQ